MSTKRNARRRSILKSVAFASVSLAAVSGMNQAVAAPANPTPTAARPLVPRYGNLLPFYGNIAPFYGNLTPFYGNLLPFYGNLTPFYGNIAPFWGDISPFYGNIAPFWGDIKPFDGPMIAGTVAPTFASTTKFWTDIKPVWDDTSTFWSTAKSSPTAANLSTLSSKINNIISLSDTQFGTAVTAKTGKSFSAGFAQPLLTKYGINLADTSSLTKLSEADRAMFFLDWYDNLMNYSGVDHVDHWMGTVHWSPALTQQQGNGDVTIGLLDFTVVGDTDVLNNIVSYGGISKFSNGHGAAVASLIVDSQDGVGIMGIAPKSKVVAYNPFDATGTAGWADIKTGIESLVANKASIVNMSLGVPGYTFHPDWKGVFTDSSVQAKVRDTVFVVAAGNEGVTQTQNVAWDVKNPQLIIVGSVGLDQTISNRSEERRVGKECA